MHFVEHFPCHNFSAGNSPPRCECFDLHNELVPYEEAWAWQKDIVGEKRALIENNKDCPDTLIVLQHHPVYTMGTASSEKYLLFDPDDAPHYVCTIRTGSSGEYLHFNPKDALYRTERGGEVTYHGPGQVCQCLTSYDCSLILQCGGGNVSG